MRRASARRYAEDEGAFFEDFASAFIKLSECGARFRPVNGIKINDESWIKTLRDSSSFGRSA